MLLDIIIYSVIFFSYECYYFFINDIKRIKANKKTTLITINRKIIHLHSLGFCKDLLVLFYDSYPMENSNQNSNCIVWYMYISFHILIYLSECPICYFWDNCSKPCVYPYFGAKCAYKCSCEEKICSFMYGCISGMNNCSKTLM